jgi:hypothetical protein
VQLYLHSLYTSSRSGHKKPNFTRLKSSLDVWFSIFRDSAVASYSMNVHVHFDLWEMRQPGCIERTGIHYPVTWRHIPEYKNWYLFHTSVNTLKFFTIFLRFAATVNSNTASCAILPHATVVQDIVNTTFVIYN